MQTEPTKPSVEFVLRTVENPGAIMEGVIPFDNPVGFEDWITRGLADGSFQIVGLQLDGEIVGHLVYRVSNDREKELVIVAMHNMKNVADTFDHTEVFVDKLARSFGVRQIRFHTLRHGLVKRGLQYGYRVSEFVMRKTLTD